MLNQLFSEATLIKQLNVETAIADGSYPASGSFIDVADLERFAFLVEVGATTSQMVFTVQQASAVNGALKDVTDATVTVSAIGDSKWYLIEVQTAKLDINNDYHYVTLTEAGAAGGDDYAAITFFGINPGEKPVTQGSDKGTIVSVVG